MIFKNLNGTTRSIFSFGLRIKVFIGSIAATGLLQGQDADQRTTRDLIQYSPRWYIPEDYNQLATHHEVHNLTGAPHLLMDEGSQYEFDQGAVLIM